MHGDLGAGVGAVVPPAFEGGDPVMSQHRRLTSLRKLRQAALDDYNAGAEIQRHARARYDALTAAIEALEAPS